MALVPQSGMPGRSVRHGYPLLAIFLLCTIASASDEVCLFDSHNCAFDGSVLTAVNDFEFAQNTNETHCSDLTPPCLNNANDGMGVVLNASLQARTTFTLGAPQNGAISGIYIHFYTNITDVAMEMKLVSATGTSLTQTLCSCGSDPGGGSQNLQIWKWPFVTSSFDITSITGIQLQFQTYIDTLYASQVKIATFRMFNMVSVSCSTDTDCQIHGASAARCVSGSCECNSNGYNGPSCQPVRDLCSGTELVWDGNRLDSPPLIITNDTVGLLADSTGLHPTMMCPNGMYPPCLYMQAQPAVAVRAWFGFELNGGDPVDIRYRTLTFQVAGTWTGIPVLAPSYGMTLVDENGYYSENVALTSNMQLLPTLSISVVQVTKAPEDWSYYDTNFNPHKVTKLLFSSTITVAAVANMWIDKIELKCPTADSCTYSGMCTKAGDKTATCTGFAGQRRCRCLYNSSPMCKAGKCTSDAQCNLGTCHMGYCHCTNNYWGPGCEFTYIPQVSFSNLATEAEIVSATSSSQMTITLSGNTFITGIDNDATVKQQLINSWAVLTASQPSGYVELKACLLAAPYVLSDQNTKLTIEIGSCPGFSLTTNLVLMLSVPGSVVVDQVVAGTGLLNNFQGITIVNLDPEIVWEGSFVTQFVTKADLLAGGHEIIASISNEKFLSGVTGNDTVRSQLFNVWSPSNTGPTEFLTGCSQVAVSDAAAWTEWPGQRKVSVRLPACPGMLITDVIQNITMVYWSQDLTETGWVALVPSPSTTVSIYQADCPENADKVLPPASVGVLALPPPTTSALFSYLRPVSLTACIAGYLVTLVHTDDNTVFRQTTIDFATGALIYNHQETYLKPGTNYTVTFTTIVNSTKAPNYANSTVAMAKFTTEPNQAPYIDTPPENVGWTVTEDTQVFRLIPGSAFTPEDYQALQVVVEPADVTAWNEIPTVIAANGFVWTLSPARPGVHVLYFHLKDDGGTGMGGVDISPTYNVTVNVSSVNDRPSFVAPTSVTVPGTGQHVYRIAWASTIDKGGPDPDEQAQVLTWNVIALATAANTLVAAPVVEQSGHLLFTTTGTQGSSQYSITLSDNGGELPSGDQPVTAPFTLTITTTGPFTAAVSQAGSAVTISWSDISDMGTLWTQTSLFIIKDSSNVVLGSAVKTQNIVTLSYSRTTAATARVHAVNSANATLVTSSPVSIVGIPSATGSGGSAGGSTPASPTFAVVSVTPNSFVLGNQSVTFTFVVSPAVTDPSSVTLGMATPSGQPQPCSDITWLSTTTAVCVMSPQPVPAFSGQAIFPYVTSGTARTVNTTNIPLNVTVTTEPGYFGITTITPRVVSSSGGSYLTISGSFGSDPRIVASVTATIGGAACENVTYISATQIICQVPAGTATGNTELVRVGLVGSQIASSTRQSDTGQARNVVVFGTPCEPSCTSEAAQHCQYVTANQSRCGCDGDLLMPSCSSSALSLIGPPVISMPEEGTTSLMRFRLTKPRDQPVEFTCTSSAPDEIDILTKTITVAPDTDTVQILLRSIPDSIRDGDQNVLVTCEATTTVSEYTSASVTLRVTVQDAAPVMYSVSPDTIPVGESSLITVIANELDGQVYVHAIMKGSDKHFWSQRSVVPRRLTSTLRSDREALLQTASTVFNQSITVNLTSVSAPGYIDVHITNYNGRSQSLTLYASDQCIEEGKYGINGECLDCPETAVCPGGDRKVAKSGFYQPKDIGSDPVECPIPDSCRGDDDGTGNFCYPPYTGPLCATCIAGYTLQGDACIKCPSPSFAYITLILDILLWTCVAISAWIFSNHENFARVIAVVSALQMVGSVGPQISSRMHPVVIGIFDVLKMFTGDYDLFQPGCGDDDRPAFEAEYFQALGYNLAIGGFMFIGIPIIRVIYSWTLRRRGKDTQAQRIADLYSSRISWAFFFWMLVIYLNMTRVSVEAVSCKKVGQKLLLLSDPRTECMEGLHFFAFAVACAVLALLTLGVPLVYTFKIWRKFRRPDTLKAEVVETAGAYIFPFLPNKTYFFLVNFAKLAGIAVAEGVFRWEHETKSLLTMVILAVAILTLLVVRPNKSWVDTLTLAAVDTFSLAVVFLNYLLVRDSGESGELPVFIWIGCISFLAVLLLVIYDFVYHVILLPIRQRRRALQADTDGTDLSAGIHIQDVITKLDADLDLDVMDLDMNEVLNDVRIDDGSVADKRNRSSQRGDLTVAGIDLALPDLVKDAMGAVGVKPVSDSGDSDDSSNSWHNRFREAIRNERPATSPRDNAQDKKGTYALRADSDTSDNSDRFAFRVNYRSQSYVPQPGDEDFWEQFKDRSDDDPKGQSSSTLNHSLATSKDRLL